MPRPNSLVARIQTVTDLGPFNIETFRRGDPTGLPMAPRLVINSDGVDKSLKFDARLNAEAVALKLSAARSLEVGGYPAYLELSGDGAILDVRVPEVGMIVRLDPMADGRVELVLDESDSVYFIDAELAKTEIEFLRASFAAKHTIAVVRGPNQTYFDARVVPVTLFEQTPPFGKIRHSDDVIAALKPVTEDRAVKLFKAMAKQTCHLPTPQEGCIPFAYVATGCFHKSHRMCELIAASNVKVAKVWAFGKLSARTKNLSGCRVSWASHVAPIVRVSTNSKPQVRVIDPTLCRTAVSVQKWLDAQNDPTARIIYTDASVFRVMKDGSGRPERPASKTLARETDWGLETYAECLRLMANGKKQPPPFSGC